jgi:ABC-type lipoprotein release transport system permease subunit
MKFIQVIANIVLYAFFVWLLYDSTITTWDPWFAFVVLFVLIVAVVTSLMPSLHASNTSPGAYPYDD